MKSIHRIGLGAVFTVASAAVWLACGDDDTTPSNTNPMDAASSNTPDVTTSSPDTGSETDGGTGTETGATPESGTSPESGTGGEAGVPSCSAYCTSIMATCTGSAAQYTDNAQCMTACALLPPGTATDTSGNTVGCRTTHAGLAKTGGLNPHCWHAGPFGYGACGSECEGFCAIATSYCSADGGFDGGPAPYASPGACTSACAGFTKIDDADGGGGVGVDGGYNAAGPAAGNTLDCREWHLSKALDMPGSSAGQNLHCNHVGATSATCM